MALLGYGQKILSSPAWPSVLQGTASPVGVTVPDFVGQFFIETTHGIPYQSVGLTNADWKGLTDYVSATAPTDTTLVWIDTTV
jgi:hypothetical protein